MSRDSVRVVADRRRPNSPPCDLSVVIIAFNSDQTLVACIESVSEILRHQVSFEILVMNNGSTDQTGEQLRRMDSVDLVLESPSNLGTTASRNHLLSESSGSYICVLDSDTEIIHWDVARSFGFIDETKGLLGGRLQYPDGTMQISAKPFPSISYKLQRMLCILLGRRLRTEENVYRLGSGIQRVDSLISAFWLFSRTLLDDVGFLDEKIFYSPEDLDYCARCAASGIPVYYYPSIRVLHRTNRLTHRNPLGPIARSHLKGLIYYFLKHRGLRRSLPSTGKSKEN